MENKQSRCITNGNAMEKTAMKILHDKFTDVNYVNGLIDFYAENSIPIEIKSCQYMIESGNPQYPKRYGRFKIDKEQHRFLEIQKGYYLFLVHHNGFLITGKLIPACDIPFAYQFTWREILNRPEFNPLEELQ